ncbi:spore coat protein CotH [Sporanaerobium hydrogeniformans]|uniref:Spore coat protein CotH n=1 Tax=Sporanaerobium hydrogeniformans TaxID=3072179 RepID=A0AC61D9N3_9FIRM|nr:CotH kinase family protein [Sporanaerobium hydrogeniformans]PHV69272.1 spore coat protein CotH [Sporanaerobium hydrogeniformans]
MIKDKHIFPLALCTIILAVIGLIGGYSLSQKNINSIEAVSSNDAIYMEKIFDKEKLLEINIEIDEKQWEELLENAMDEQYVAANLTINGETVSSVGIRAKGNSSLSMVASDSTTDRFSFKIKFDEYIKGQSFYGLDKMVLNNGIGDATYMKEYLAYDMYNSMGIATPGFAFAKVSVNDEVWGVYLAVETLEESFIERNYGSLDGNLYKVESDKLGAGGNKQGGQMGQMPPGGKNGIQRPSNQDNETMQGNMQPPGGMPDNLNNEAMEGNMQPSEDMPDNPNNQAMQGDMAPPTEMQGGLGADKGSSSGTNLVYKDDELSSYSGIFDNTIFKKTTDADKQKIVDMMKNLSEGTNLEDYLDVDEVLRYFAINTFIVNLDSYASNMKHNFYLYEENGKVQILPWDYNLAFAGYGSLNATQAINFPIDTPVTDSMENSPLIAKLLEVEPYKEQYHNYLNKLVTEYVENGKYEVTIQKVNELISEAVKEDPTAFYSYEEYQTAVAELIQFGKDRATSIKAQLSGEQPSESYGSIATTVHLNNLGSMGGGKGGFNNQPPQDLSKNGPGRENRTRPNEMNKLEKASLTIEEKGLLLVAGITLVGGSLLILCFKRRKYRS